MLTPRVFRLVAVVFAVIAVSLAFATFSVRAQEPPAPPLFASAAPAGTVLTTAISYQGRLTQGGAPVNATCDFAFALYDAVNNGTQIGGSVTATLAVSQGLFTAPLDFGVGAFNGQGRWLATQVRCPAGSGAYTALLSRQPFLPAPYALALPAFTTQPGLSAPSIVGDPVDNTLPLTVSGGVIAGGAGNQVLGSWSTIGGGVTNMAIGGSATVAGGSNNNATGPYATAGGGYANAAPGRGATVPGGEFNLAQGTMSLAAGYSAKSLNSGCFTWADHQNFDFTCATDNQFALRATGGVSMVSGIDGAGNATSGLFVPANAALQVGIGGSAFKRIQSGEAIAGSNLAGGTLLYTITFPTAFSATPQVLLTTRNDPTLDVDDTFGTTVRRVNAFVFVVNIRRLDVSGGSWAQRLLIHWIAWE